MFYIDLMRKNAFYILIAAVLLLSACSSGREYAIIHTTKGEIKIKLYDATKNHKENFVALADDGFYDDVLFHRVIKSFMIQTGDPESQNAPQGKPLGEGGPGYKLDAEIVDSLYHKRGAVAAARLPDTVNPEKESSGSQFYIVTGKVYTPEELDQMEAIVNQRKRNSFINQFFSKPENSDLRKELQRLSNSDDTAAFNELSLEAEMKIEAEYEKLEKFSFNKKQREIYTSVGGTPMLDGDYTIFGEVVEGMEVVEEISKVKTDKRNRPLNDIKITKIELSD